MFINHNRHHHDRQIILINLVCCFLNNLYSIIQLKRAHYKINAGLLISSLLIIKKDDALNELQHHLLIELLMYVIKVGMRQKVQAKLKAF